MNFSNRTRICMSMMICLAVALVMSVAYAQNTELPLAATKLLETNFSGMDTRWVEVERTRNGAVKEYEVTLVNGWELEFDADGNWKDIDCRADAVPAALIPQPVSAYVSEQYPGQKICTIKRDARGYDIELSNRLELEFDLQGNFLRID